MGTTCTSTTGCQSCEIAGTCSQEEKERHARRLIEAAMEKVGKKFLVLSGKGGVGKSSVAVNLACVLGQRGNTVGILDADIHGPNIPKMLGVESRRQQSAPGTDAAILPIRVSDSLKVMSIGFFLQSEEHAVIWRGPMKHGIMKQFLGEVHWGALDYLIIDLPPGTGDEALSIAQLIGSVDGAVIVTTPQDVALLDSQKSISFCRELGIANIGVVENMSGMICPHCAKQIDLFKTGGGEKIAEKMKIPFLGRVPLDPAMVLSGDEGRPFVAAHPESAATASFNGIVDAWMDIMNDKESKRTKELVTMKKIAFACEENKGLESEMSGHFGRCPFFMMVEVEGRDVKNVEAVVNPYFNGHVPGVVPQFINTQKANVMIAGGMGPKAIDMFNGFGIEVATGVGGKVGNVLQAYLDGRVSGTVACAHDHADSCGGH